MSDLHGHSITYRIARGPQRGRKAFSLQTLPPHSIQDRSVRSAKVAGFSLHAGPRPATAGFVRLFPVFRAALPFIRLAGVGEGWAVRSLVSDKDVKGISSIRHPVDFDRRTWSVVILRTRKGFGCRLEDMLYSFYTLNQFCIFSAVFARTSSLI